MKLHLKIILAVPVVGLCVLLKDVTSMSETVHIEPKMVRGAYGQPACFNCTTSYLEAYWRVENKTIPGNGDRENGQTFASYCFSITKSMTVTCHGVTISSSGMLTETDTAEIIMIEDPPTIPGTGVLNTDAPDSHPSDNSAPLAVDLIGGNGSLIGSGNVSLTLWFNISSDSEGNPLYICAEIKHPIGENTTTCTSQYQHDSYYSLVVTVYWMLDPSIVNVCDLNLTVRLSTIHENVSSPFSNLITVPVDCPGKGPTNRPSGSGVTIIVPVVVVVAVVAGLVIALLLYYKFRCTICTKNIEAGKGELHNGESARQNQKTKTSTSLLERLSNDFTLVQHINAGIIPTHPNNYVTLTGSVTHHQADGKATVTPAVESTSPKPPQYQPPNKEGKDLEGAMGEEASNITGARRAPPTENDDVSNDTAAPVVESKFLKPPSHVLHPSPEVKEEKEEENASKITEAGGDCPGNDTASENIPASNQSLFPWYGEGSEKLGPQLNVKQGSQ